MGREDADAAERAAVSHHLEEASVVRRGRDEARAAREALARTVDVIPLSAWAVGSALGVIGRVARIHGREARSLPCGNEEIRVIHLQGTGDAGPDQLVERHPRGTLGDAAEDVGVVAVHPLLAGLRREGQRREPLHRWADRLILVGGIPPPPGGGSEPFGGVQRRDELVGAV